MRHFFAHSFTWTMVSLFLFGAVAQAAASHAHPTVEQLTQNLVSLQARYAQANAAERGQLLNSLLTAAADRQQLLMSIIEDDPGAVLRVALPAAVRSSLPVAAQAYVEKRMQVEGALEVQVEDRSDGHRYHYALETATKRLSLHFAADPPTDLLSGAKIRAKGVQVDGALALTSGSTSVQALSAPLSNTFGEQKTLVILVNFQDGATQPYTAATAQNVVFGTTSNFDLENSFQQTWLTGDVVGWFTIPLSSTVCDTSSLATYAKQAATAAGVTLSNYSHYVYAFPNNACAWWGLGSVGGNPSQAWINGSFRLKVVAHEMGHNFGLFHSKAWECGTTTLGSSCSSIEYGDSVDMMGNPSIGHFNAFQKERLGWLDYGASPPITTVQTGGVYALDPYETVSANPKALKILKSTDLTTGKKTWYYIEFRRPVGVDSFLSSNSNVLNGVVIHTGSESNANSSYLLDLTPDTSSWSDPALTVDQSFLDPESGVTITPMSVESTGATVAVSFGPLACVPANPTLSLSPAETQWSQPGASVTYTVTVTNNNNAGCTASDFNLQIAAPSGWVGAFAAPTLTLSPGTSASTALTVTSLLSAPEGFYTIPVTTTDTANTTSSASTAATVSLVASLTISVATNQASYTRNQTVSVTATVSNGETPIANASVTFTLTKANGAVVTSTALTGENGVAVFSYRLKRKDPVGNYQARGVVTLNGIPGSAETSFLVQ